MKIISLTAKDFLTGISQYRDSRYGFFTSATGVNLFGVSTPPTSAGTIAFSSTPAEIGDGTIDGNINGAAVDGSDMYGITSGKLFKIASIDTDSTVSSLRTVASLAYGIEVFQTSHASATKYLYYWQATQIGRYDLASTYADNWQTGLTSGNHPTHRVEDRIFFPNGNNVGMIYDDGTNADPAINLTAFNIPKDFNINSISDDGYYLIIVASRTNSSLAESRIYFWDWKNNLTSWTKEYVVQDKALIDVYTIKGISYTIGASGLFIFNFNTPPEKIRLDVTATQTNCLGSWNDALTIATSTGVKTYGKAKPQLPTALLNPFGAGGNIVWADFSRSSNYGYYSSGNNLYRQLHTSLASVSDGAWTSGQILLDDLYSINKITVWFHLPIASGDTFTLQLNGSYAGGISSTCSATGFSTDGAVKYVNCFPTNDLISDEVGLQFSSISGTHRISKIDIYGERIEH